MIFKKNINLILGNKSPQQPQSFYPFSDGKNNLYMSLCLSVCILRNKTLNQPQSLNLSIHFL